MKQLLVKLMLVVLWYDFGQAAPIIDFQPATVSAAVGDLFNIDIALTNFVDLYAYSFDLGFSPSVLQLVSIAQGAFLSGAGPTVFSAGVIDNLGGTATSTVESVLGPIPGRTGAGSLVRLQFSVVGIGSSSITVFNQTFLDSSLSVIDVTVGRAMVVAQTTGVPEPKSTSLAALGVALLWLKRRHRQVVRGQD